ncbi:MAG: T9SS type A sorting domain-containing protein [Sphingobacteriales bacterium]|nr:T9SS type A sorting domain-containing protein [Sphingobacteriales bacterium]
MRRFLLIFLFISCFFNSKAATIYWDGGALTSNWSDAANWSPDGIPTSADDVVLDNSLVNSSYSVNLPGGSVTVTVNTLTITPFGSYNITLTLSSGNTADPGLDVTGSGDALVLNNGAILKNASGAASGSGISITNTFRINNGGHYIHNTGRQNAPIVSKLSTAVGTELGEFEYDDPTGSTILSLSGSTFGTLTLSALTNGTTSYIGSGAMNCNVKGNLNIYTGVSFAISMSANFIVAGNYTQASPSTFNLQSSTNNNTVQIGGNFTFDGSITESNTGLPILELNGSSNQSITAASGTITGDVTFKMNNASGATLNSPLSLPYDLILTAGNIDLGANNLTVSGSITGGGTSSYIKTSGTGYLKQISVNNLAFPIGNSSYNPVTISNAGGTNNFYARVQDGIIPSIAFPTYGINRTWSVYSSANTSGVTAAFQYRGVDANAGVPQPQNMELLINTDPITPGPWSIVAGNGTLTPSGTDPYVVTTLTSLTISTSSQVGYALGKSGGWILPVDCIISCKAEKRNNTGFISWAVNSCNDISSFEIQRSSANSSFQTIGTIIPAANETGFTFIDRSLLNGTNLYRIRINKLSGSLKYSNTVALIHNSNDILITSIAPNPAQSSATITVSAARQTIIELKIFDMSGRIVKQWQSSFAEGSNTVVLNVEGLPPGVYHLLAGSADAKSFSRFIKQ